MKNRNFQQLLERIVDDYRTLPNELELARRLAQEYSELADEAKKEKSKGDLSLLLATIESRNHRLDSAGSAAGDSRMRLAWTSLGQELQAAERKWKKLAFVQFCLGMALVPIVLVVVVSVICFTARSVSASESALLATLTVASVTYSFLLLRIHQQARQAEERIVEKQVGLAFLRMATEGTSGDSQFRAMIDAGTKMFLGHYASPTVPLGPDDLVSSIGSLKSE